eukprot:3872811-Pyramimonas_sp.AAC.1
MGHGTGPFAPIPRGHLERNPCLRRQACLLPEPCDHRDVPGMALRPPNREAAEGHYTGLVAPQLRGCLTRSRCSGSTQRFKVAPRDHRGAAGITIGHSKGEPQGSIDGPDRGQIVGMPETTRLLFGGVCVSIQSPMATAMQYAWHLGHPKGRPLHDPDRASVVGMSRTKRLMLEVGVFLLRAMLITAMY